MAQLDAQQVQMHFGRVRVHDLVGHALEACAWIKEDHSVRIDVPDALEVRADPAMLQKVICNLLENAAKYSSPGSTVTVTAEARNGKIVMSVADQGIGIDSSDQALIFERFYRARSRADGTPGTGMGLAISRAIVEAHGGVIGVVSQPAHGSVFSVTIPNS
jgi:two-component system sensor histidine kinase KdpD